MELVLSGNGVELARVETVYADVQRGEPGSAPGGDVARQPIAVSGDGDLPNGAVFPHGGDNVGKIATQRRLTAGQTHFFSAGRGEGARDASNFIEREKAFVAHALRLIAVGQAVGAAEVTDIRHRETQVVKPTCKCISKL